MGIRLKNCFNARLEKIAAQPSVLQGIKRGIEREALRIKPSGELAQTPHPSGLGSALTNGYITTDYAESLVELITPASEDADATMAQLKDIHAFVLGELGEEKLWPLSMPCYVESEDKIRIAQYGPSHIGQMKTLYREGLKHRYGSIMQVISGVHFNFSFSEAFWQHSYDSEGQGESLDAHVSNRYFDLIRNFKRFSWILPYLFGASPALCNSFVKSQDTDLEFESLGKGTLYLPYATSLRMSDLGYTNKEQASLNIGYNHLEEYVDGLRRAISTNSARFEEIGVKTEQGYRQLNANVLQIENEYYSSVRPKRVAQSGEKPSDALARGGVEYVEVRALDVNPFVETGISLEQVDFIDLFLIYCALAPSGPMCPNAQSQVDENVQKVVLYGRKPGLALSRGEETISLHAWLSDIFDDLQRIAEVMDKAYSHQRYGKTIASLRRMVDDPEQTLSGQLLSQLKAEGVDNGEFAIALARQHKRALAEHTPGTALSLTSLQQEASLSVEKQQGLEQQDQGSLDAFLQEYFEREPVPVREDLRKA